MPSRVKIIATEKLKTMHTGSLMRRRKALLAGEESIELSDWDADYVVSDGYIEFKQTETWQRAYRELKRVLNTRAHWPEVKPEPDHSGSGR